MEFEVKTILEQIACRREINLAIGAESKLGEMLADRTDGSPKRTVGGKFDGREPDLPEGITKKMSHEAQTIAENPEKVEQIIAEAKEEEKIPTPDYVYKKIKKSESTKKSYKPRKLSKKMREAAKERIKKIEKDQMGKEFKQGFELLSRAIKNEKALGWTTTPKEVALKYIGILKDIIEV